jgi:hypothetical protein
MRDVADRNRHTLNKRWFGSRVREPEKLRLLALIAALAYAIHKVKGVTLAEATRVVCFARGTESISEQDVEDFRKRLTRKEGKVNDFAAAWYRVWLDVLSDQSYPVERVLNEVIADRRYKNVR